MRRVLSMNARRGAVPRAPLVNLGQFGVDLFAAVRVAVDPALGLLAAFYDSMGALESGAYTLDDSAAGD